MSNNSQVFAITPTGCRPEGLALLGEYLTAQTYSGPLIWVVVDDCDPPTRIPFTRPGIEVQVIRPPWRWKPGKNTQAECLASGLFLPGPEDRVLILEDDDVYLPAHVSTVLRGLERVDLVGERESRYYNVTTSRSRVLRGKYHASLCSVGTKGSATELLLNVCAAGGSMIDMKLWRGFAGAKELLNTHNVIGIKGLPGRPGIGVGHRDRFGTPDTNGVLRQWAGEYAENYDIFRRAA